MRLLTTLLALAALPAVADEPRGTVEIGTRTFLVDQVPWETERQPNFLPINGVDWVHAIMDADPIMGPRRVVFFIHDERPSMRQLLSQGWRERHFGRQDLVPEAFRVDGLTVEVNPRDPPPLTSFLYLDDDDAPTWKTSCTFRYPPEDRSEFSGCSMMTTYPADPDISVNLRIYAPPYVAGIGESFPALAARMVEILACLDVTDDPPATRAEAEARLDRLRAENPELRGCKLNLFS